MSKGGKWKEVLTSQNTTRAVEHSQRMMDSNPRSWGLWLIVYKFGKLLQHDEAGKVILNQATRRLRTSDHNDESY